MDKLKMHTPDLAAENFAKLAELFPNAITETADENGVIIRAVDPDILAQEINTHVLSAKEERYQFTWPDKRKSILLANAPIAAALRPCREESVNFDTTENLYIEGDNLDVLKLLRETYLNRVKMIYIDPPYNTSSDFIYNDDFTEDAESFLSRDGQFDELGNRLVKNPDTNGRFHTDWLNMIFPRLRVARDLLTEEGVLFISIDENEVHNLRKVCDDIFGVSNFISLLVWQNKKGGGNDSQFIATEHEFILVYAKSKPNLHEFYEQYSDEYATRYKEEDEKGKFFWDTFKRKSGKQYYPIECPDGTVMQYDDDGNPISWLRSQPRFLQDVKEDEIRIIKIRDKWSVQFKQRMPEGKKPRSIFTTEFVVSDKGTTSTGGDDVYEYFKKDIFSNPKPVELLKFVLGFGLEKSDIVIDFFSGSGTIAEAVMSLNASDDGKRKYIAVQLQEDIDKSLTGSSANAKRVAENAVSVLDEMGLPHILTEIGKERIRRAGRKIVEESPLDRKGLDIGFRVLKLDSSNMKDVYYTPDEYAQMQFNLSGFMDNIKEDRTAEDLLFQVMLDLGIPLSVAIRRDGESWNVNDGYLIACFGTVDTALITEIAKRKPYYAVFRDSSFAGDSAMVNFEQVFATYSPTTIRRVL
ncbi:MAG: site-specific DNA-methyltransferase [Oscillospiraceae bacterium]|nr:site-specific DNA-methyltransferase [Oscillospiraceae bacterium]